MTTSYHISHGLTSKTLTKTAKNTHTSIQYTTQRDNGHHLIKIKRALIVKDHWIHRIQFPLRQAAACTIHVSQSSTYTEIYVDLQTTTKPPTAFWEHMHYVAFSRVSSISGLYIENNNEQNISISKKVSDYLNNSPHIITYKHRFNSMTKTHVTSYSSMYTPSKNTLTQ